MPLCPRSRVEPVAEHMDINGWWHFMCPVCLVCTPRTSRDYDQARFYFWKEHDFRNKEKPVSTSDYKRGVEDGTAAFGSEHVFPGTFWKVHTPGCELWGEPLGARIEQLLKERRKTLLTKKVTKWTTVWSGDEIPLRTDVALYDTKEDAEKRFPHRDLCANYVGAFPIEMEIEI